MKSTSKPHFSRRSFLAATAILAPSVAYAREVSPILGADAVADWRLLMGPGAISAGADVLFHPEPISKSGPFLSGDRECGQNPYVFGTLLYDSRRRTFRLWYQAYNRGARPRTAVMYAESSDGSDWSFPYRRGACSRGPTSNIVLEPVGVGDLYSPSVVIDPDDDPSRRYKMLYSDFTGGKETYTHGGVCVAFSPDGLSWTRFEGNPVLPFVQSDRAASDVVDVCRNPITGEFELYAKGWTGWRQGRDGVKRPRYRTITRSVSRDFVRWSEPEIVINHRFDRADPQSYGMPVSFIGDLRVGLLRSYKLPGDSTIDIRLAASRDGRRWTYPIGEKTFIERGAAGSFDSGMIMTTPLVTVGSRHYAVSGGWTGSHEDPSRRASLGLIEIAKHRFVGLAGAFTTAAPVRGSQIMINAYTRSAPIGISVVDGNGQVLPVKIAPFSGDALQHPLRIVSGRLPNNSFSLRFQVPADARVFAYAAL